MNNQRSLPPSIPLLRWDPWARHQTPNCSGYVFTTVCMHFGWVKCRAQIPSMGHHTWLHVNSLSLNSFMPGCANHFTPDCFLNEGQFKAGFVEKLKLKYGHFHRKERRGVRWSSCIIYMLFYITHWDHFKKTLKNPTTLWKMGIQCPLWSTATIQSDLL